MNNDSMDFTGRLMTLSDEAKVEIDKHFSTIDSEHVSKIKAEITALADAVDKRSHNGNIAIQASWIVEKLRQISGEVYE